MYPRLNLNETNERSDLDDDPGDEGNEESTGILAEDIVDAQLPEESKAGAEVNNQSQIVEH